MRRLSPTLLGSLALLLLLGLARCGGPPAFAQGTLNVALQQQMAYTNCATFTNACGTPLSGGLLYFYQIGTVSTQQDSFQDTALTLKNPWPLVLDANGRVPMFYLANGSVHVRLTDANGVVQFDVSNALVIGPSSGGGGGSSIDPTTIASTGDIKSRATTEFLTGWVKLNAQTIGSATSGATQRANADTQALFIYLWSNCPDPHCPVIGGRGASGLADFNANKQITMPDLRGRICSMVGVDDMGNSPAGRITAQNVTSGGGDGVTTPNATGGEANHTMQVSELATHSHTATSTVTDPGHSHQITAGGQNNGLNTFSFTGVNSDHTNPTQTATTGITVATTNANTGTSTPFNNMQPSMLGSCYMKL